MSGHRTLARVTSLCVVGGLLTLANGCGPRLLAGERAAEEFMEPIAEQQRTEPSPLLEEAKQALMRMEFETAERLFHAVVEGGSSADAVGEAHRRLAVLAWRHRGDPQDASFHLEAALRLGTAPSETQSELARLELSQSHRERARHAAQHAMETATSAVDSVRAVTLLAKATLPDVASPGWPSRESAPRLRALQGNLQRVVEESPEALEPIRKLLIAALFLDDGPAALAAWRAYYAGVLDRPGPLGAAADTLARVLPRWRGAESAPADRRAAIEAFAASAQFDAAHLLATDPRLRPELRVEGLARPADIVLYNQFLREVAALSDEYHRRVSIGHVDSERFEHDLAERARELHRRLSWPGGPPALDPDDESASDAWDEIRDRFGGHKVLGGIAGVTTLLFGHEVVDERRTVEQYGHTAEVRFVALDGMAADDYQTWAWDGAARTGGWQAGNVIVQIRPAYAGGGGAAWERLMSAGVADEASRSADGPFLPAERCGFLPGLRERMELQALVLLRDSLAAEGRAGRDLRHAFIAAFEELNTESSIFLHESRHAIDHTIGITDSEELEFRAKLSEVAFARFPRIALRSILSANIGDPTPHGQANERVVCGLVDWMEANRGAIEGLEPDMSLLQQLPLLTDEQLRAAARSMDPLAR